MTQQFPKVYIPYKVSEIITWLWRDHARLEWSIIGKLENIDGRLFVSDIFVPKQKNSQAYTEMTDPVWDLQNYLLETDKFMEAGKWRLRLHSHNTMQPFWSGTDNATRKSLCTDVFFEKERGYGWALSIVIGNGAKYHATVDYCYGEWTNAVRCKQDVEVVVWLIDEDFTVPEEELQEYVNTLVFEEPNTAINELVPSDISSLILADSVATIERKKQESIDEYIEFNQLRDAELREESLVAQWILQADYWLEWFITELKEKERQPITLPQYTGKKKQKWKKQKTQKTVTGWELFGNDSGVQDNSDMWTPLMISDDDLISEWYLFSHQKLAYLDPDKWDWILKHEAKDRICASRNSQTQMLLPYEVTRDQIKDYWFVYKPTAMRYIDPTDWAECTHYEAQVIVADYHNWEEEDEEWELTGNVIIEWEVKRDMPTYNPDDFWNTELEDLVPEQVTYNDLVKFWFVYDHNMFWYTHIWKPWTIFSEQQAKIALVQLYKLSDETEEVHYETTRKIPDYDSIDYWHVSIEALTVNDVDDFNLENFWFTPYLDSYIHPKLPWEVFTKEQAKQQIVDTYKNTL